ncbi:hypothetical protein CHELA40_30256 [Chelatococcus asaccharovorans]|nr:hypothetical protein CHELA40_30256 [Chelatococcus asaccharovorans]
MLLFPLRESLRTHQARVPHWPRSLRTPRHRVARLRVVSVLGVRYGLPAVAQLVRVPPIRTKPASHVGSAAAIEQSSDESRSARSHGRVLRLPAPAPNAGEYRPYETSDGLRSRIP